MNDRKIVYIRGPLAKPTSIASGKPGSLAYNFLSVYRTLIDYGCMDLQSFAGAKVKNYEFKHIISRCVDNHLENLTEGMVRVYQNEDIDKYIMNASDVCSEKVMKESSLMFKMDVDCIFKFRAKLKSEKAAFKYTFGGNLQRIPVGSYVPQIDKLSLRKLENIKDNRLFRFGQVGEYGVIGFSSDWDTEVVMNILNRYWDFKK